MAADQNTHPSRDHAAAPDAQPTTMINLRYVALLLGPGPVWSVAAFAQGFSAKGMPVGNRPIP